MEKFINAAISFFTISSGILAISYIWGVRKVNQIQNSIVSASEIASNTDKIGKIIVVEGFAQGTPLKEAFSSFNKGQVLLNFKVQETLSRKLKLINSLQISPKQNHFFLSENHKLVINPQNILEFNGFTSSESISKLELSFWDSLKSIFLNIPYFRSQKEITVNLNSHVFVEGLLYQRSDKIFELLDPKIYSSLEKILGPLKNKSYQVILLSLSCVVLIGLLSLKYYKNASHKNEFKDGPKCRLCIKKSNVVVKPCFHFAICKSCLFESRYCPVCGRYIEGYMLVCQD